MSNLTQPDDKPLQPVPPQAQNLPVICMYFTYFEGDPIEAKEVAREIAKTVSAEVQRIVCDCQGLRIVVTLQ